MNAAEAAAVSVADALIELCSVLVALEDTTEDILLRIFEVYPTVWLW